MLIQIKPRKAKFGFKMHMSGVDEIIDAGRVCSFAKQLSDVRIELVNRMGVNRLLFYTDNQESCDRLANFTQERM